MTSPAAASPEASLVRALGVRQLAASIVNVTVGAGIFVLPAAVAAGLGSAAPAAYLVCAVAMALIVTSIALAGSRVSLTGGIYAYVEVAFGPYVGFLAGVLQWLMLWLTAGGLLSAFVDQVGLLVPGTGQGLPRAAIIVATVSLLAFVNVRGVAIGARVIEGAVVAKLLPLAVFLAVGVFFVQPQSLAWPGWPPGDKLGETVLLLIFAFVGIEVALVPSGEVRDPRRTVPRAIYLALGLTTALYLAIQAVAQGVLGAEMARHAEAPLAAAAGRFLGAGGRLLVLAGGAVSMFGYLCGDMLSSPRSLYAFGRDGFLPRALARVHPSFHTPHVAIVVHAVPRRPARDQQQLPLPRPPLQRLRPDPVLPLLRRGAAPRLAASTRRRAGLRPPRGPRHPGRRHGGHHLDPRPRHPAGVRGARRDLRRGVGPLRRAAARARLMLGSSAGARPPRHPEELRPCRATRDPQSIFEGDLNA